MSDAKRLEFFVYPGFTALDLVGPHHMLSGIPAVEKVIVSLDGKPVTSDTGLTIVPDAAVDDMQGPAFGIFAPGGMAGTLDAMQSALTRNYFARRAPDCEYVMSVCTGSLILGAAGLLEGYRATSHWISVELLSRFGAIPQGDRVVFDRNRITGAGVTAGVDFGLSLVQSIMGDAHASAVQLLAEYDPAPPLQSGHPKTAAPEAVDTVMQYTSDFRILLEKAYPAN